MADKTVPAGCLLGLNYISRSAQHQLNAEENVRRTIFKAPQMTWVVTNEHITIRLNILLFRVGNLNIYE